MSALPDRARSLGACPEVIFIVYCLPADAEGRGYADWLRGIDMPFFNAIPGVRHYANWRVSEILRGEPPIWDWFDFQGLSDATALESVWFNPDLDEFRTNWVKLWGYGHSDPPPVLRHAYMMELISADPPGTPWTEALLAGGNGEPPTAWMAGMHSGTARSPLPAAANAGQNPPGFIWRVHTTLHKHFTGRDPSRPWQTPSRQFNPLGLDWICCLPAQAEPPHEANFVARVNVVAAPDQVGLV